MSLYGSSIKPWILRLSLGVAARARTPMNRKVDDSRIWEIPKISGGPSMHHN